MAHRSTGTVESLGDFRNSKYVQSDKSPRMFDAIEEQFFCIPTEPDRACATSYEMTGSVTMNKKREDLLNKWFPVRLKHRAVNLCRVLLARTGLTPLVKRFGKQMVRSRRMNG